MLDVSAVPKVILFFMNDTAKSDHVTWTKAQDMEFKQKGEPFIVAD